MENIQRIPVVSALTGTRHSTNGRRCLIVAPNVDLLGRGGDFIAGSG